MTQNQIAYARAQEEARSNLAKEAETKRSNQANERHETARNVIQGIGTVGNVATNILGKLNPLNWFTKSSPTANVNSWKF